MNLTGTGSNPVRNSAYISERIAFILKQRASDSGEALFYDCFNGKSAGIT
jgi:hypothetical protein